MIYLSLFSAKDMLYLSLFCARDMLYLSLFFAEDMLYLRGVAPSNLFYFVGHFCPELLKFYHVYTFVCSDNMDPPCKRKSSFKLE
jgi:hypothetical protein